MMRRLLRSSFVLLAFGLALAACARGPAFSQVAARVPPVPAGEARLFFYRWLEPYETLSWSPVYLNGRTVGVSAPGSVFYRDVPPGTYTIAVRSEGIYPNQFKTVTVAPGQVFYVRIESLASWNDISLAGERRGDTFVVTIVSPETGRREIQDLEFRRG